MIEITAQPAPLFVPPVDDWEGFLQICHEEDFSGLPMLGYRQDYEILATDDLSILRDISDRLDLDDLTRSDLS